MEKVVLTAIPVLAEENVVPAVAMVIYTKERVLISENLNVQDVMAQVIAVCATEKNMMIVICAMEGIAISAMVRDYVEVVTEPVKNN